MVKISPLKGITYNLEKIDINSVTAPPYDVISDEERDELYRLSDYNIVRLILGKINAEDNDTSNRYTRAAKDFQQWQEKEVLVKSDSPCMN